MGKKSTPKPPDLTAYSNAMMENGKFSYMASQDQLAWAREQDVKNRELLQQVLSPQLEAQANQAQWAKEDRARYTDVYQPLENNLVQDFQSYDTPERRAQERGRAMADVSQNFESQRQNALQRLESYGVDPSVTRNAALDVGMRTAQAAATAGAATNADRVTEAQGRALRSEAINIGRGMPAQYAQQYAQSVGAGAAAMGGANQTFGTSAGAMGNPTAWAGLGQSGAQGAANITNSGFQNQMQVANLQQQQNSALMSGLGSAVGMAGMMMADGGDIPPDGAIPSTPGPINGPGDGSGIDDQVPIMASKDEYIIPADVVRKKGVEFFDKLLEKYHTPAAQQRQEAPPPPPQQALPTGAWA